MSINRNIPIALSVLITSAIACGFVEPYLWDLFDPQEPADLGDTFAAQAATDVRIDECLAPLEAFSWAYEITDIDAYGTNIVCNADFELTNLGQESLAAIVRVAWDNTVQQSQYWQVHPLALGETSTEPVNETHLAEDAYIRVTHLLVVRDIPECQWAASPTQQAMWESIASPIQPLACP